MSAAPTTSRSSQLRDLIEATGSRCQVARYQKGREIFLQGDPCESVVHIENGLVGLSVVTAAGKQAIVGVLGPGAFLGVEVLSDRDDVVHGQTAIAMTATEALVVPKAQITRLIRPQPAILGRFVAHILERQARLQEDLTNQILNSGEQRLAHALLSLAGYDGQDACGGALPDVSQEFIAEMVGTTRARVNALLGKFKKRGFIIQAGDGVLRIRPSLLHVVADSYRAVDHRLAS